MYKCPSLLEKQRNAQQKSELTHTPAYSKCNAIRTNTMNLNVCMQTHDLNMAIRCAETWCTMNEMGYAMIKWMKWNWTQCNGRHKIKCNDRYKIKRNGRIYHAISCLFSSLRGSSQAMSEVIKHCKKEQWVIEKYATIKWNMRLLKRNIRLMNEICYHLVPRFWMSTDLGCLDFEANKDLTCLNFWTNQDFRCLDSYMIYDLL